MTWVAVALAIVAAGLAGALVWVTVALSRTIRSLRSVVDDLGGRALEVADVVPAARQNLKRPGELNVLARGAPAGHRAEQGDGLLLRP